MNNYWTTWYIVRNCDSHILDLAGFTYFLVSSPPLTYDGGLLVQIQNKLSESVEKGWSHQSYRFLVEYIKRKLRPDGTAYQVSLDKYVTSVVLFYCEMLFDNSKFFIYKIMYRYNYALQ